MLARIPKKEDDVGPIEKLEFYSMLAVDVCKKAKKHKKSVNGDNHYGNKLAELRADATNEFRQLSASSVGDTTALAELIQLIFGVDTVSKARLAATRDLIFTLKTTWKASPAKVVNDGGLFPQVLLVQTNRGYIITIGRQMNGNYAQGWYDACAVMMRRLIEISIIEAFESKGVAAKIKGADGNYLQLTDLIGLTMTEPILTLSRNAKKFLPQLRDVGHFSAHGRFFTAQKEDLDRIQSGCRIVIEELLHHAGLLKASKPTP
jgi:hypothetical protein